MMMMIIVTHYVDCNYIYFFVYMGDDRIVININNICLNGKMFSLKKWPGHRRLNCFPCQD